MGYLARAPVLARRSKDDYHTGETVILIGRYDPPVVRRVAVTLNFYGIPCERQVLSVFGDFDAMPDVNPLGKVPALKLDNVETLFDSQIVLDFLDELVLTPARRPERRA